MVNLPDVTDEEPARTIRTADSGPDASGDRPARAPVAGPAEPADPGSAMTPRFNFVFRWFARRFFGHFDLDDETVERLHTLEARGSVVYVMRYSSRLDYLLFNTLFLRDGLRLSSFANGINFYDLPTVLAGPATNVLAQARAIARRRARRASAVRPTPDARRRGVLPLPAHRADPHLLAWPVAHEAPAGRTRPDARGGARDVRPASARSSSSRCRSSGARDRDAERIASSTSTTDRCHAPRISRRSGRSCSPIAASR